MPYNETTTRRPDGSKTVRKEHIDPTTGKCTKIEIMDYPSTTVDFSVMNSYTKQPKTTIIIPKDDDDNGQDGGFHSTKYPTIGKTTVGKTQTKTVPSAGIPAPTTTPLKVQVPTVQQATSGTTQKDSGAAGGGDNKTASSVPEQSLPTSSSSSPTTTTTAADGGCGCVIQ